MNPVWEENEKEKEDAIKVTGPLRLKSISGGVKISEQQFFQGKLNPSWMKQ
jgi:hypothetical protein